MSATEDERVEAASATDLSDVYNSIQRELKLLQSYDISSNPTDFKLRMVALQNKVNSLKELIQPKSIAHLRDTRAFYEKIAKTRTIHNKVISSPTDALLWMMVYAHEDRKIVGMEPVPTIVQYSTTLKPKKITNEGESMFYVDLMKLSVDIVYGIYTPYPLKANQFCICMMENNTCTPYAVRSTKTPVIGDTLVFNQPILRNEISRISANPQTKPILVFNVENAELLSRFLRVNVVVGMFPKELMYEAQRIFG